MLQKMHVMTKLTVFIEAYKLGNVAALLDAPVFAQFKAHLRAADGEDELEEFGLEDQEALDEIEDELESESGETAHSLGVYNDSDDSDESGDGEETSALRGAGSDGEWEDEDEDEFSDDEEEEFEDDDEEEADQGTETGNFDHSVDSEESGDHSESGHHSESGSHSESGDHSESSEESGKGHHFADGTSIKYKGEQHHTGSPSAWTHTEWNADTTSWPQFKKDLLDILTQLRNSIIHKMKQAQDDEVNAGIALADY